MSDSQQSASRTLSEFPSASMYIGYRVESPPSKLMVCGTPPFTRITVRIYHTPQSSRVGLIAKSKTLHVLVAYRTVIKTNWPVNASWLEVERCRLPCRSDRRSQRNKSRCIPHPCRSRGSNSSTSVVSVRVSPCPVLRSDVLAHPNLKFKSRSLNGTTARA